MPAAFTNALNLHTATCLMMPSDQFSGKFFVPPNAQRAIDECHIYIIGTRPRAYFVPSTVIHLFDEITGQIRWRVSGTERTCGFRMKAKAPRGERFVVDRYPHRKLISAKGLLGGQRFIPIQEVIHGGSFPEQSLRDYEVLYVGQSYASGNRNAFDRLKKHETFQRILADHAENRPDDELVVFMFQYLDPSIFTHINPFSKPRKSLDEEAKQFANIVTDVYTREEVINLAEASLIRYFQPEYNNHYVDHFPANRHAILARCYERDFDGLIVEVNTQELNARLKIGADGDAGAHHIARFDLHDDKLRRSFFKVPMKDGVVLDFKSGSGALF